MQVGGWTGEGSVSAALVTGSETEPVNYDRQILYIGGGFVDSATSGCEAVCRYRVDGDEWEKLGEGRFVGAVHSMAVSGEMLFAGGTLEVAGGVDVGGVASWDGRKWSALGQVQVRARVSGGGWG